MGARTPEDLHAYRAARALKLEVYRLVKATPEAYQDWTFRRQIFSAAASHEINIAEGFRRFGPAEFAQFLTVSRGSLEETAKWIQDGIDRGYFSPEACGSARALAAVSGRIVAALHKKVKSSARLAKKTRKPIREADNSQAIHDDKEP